VGAGALPVDAHRRRPPIPIVPVDARARDAARAAGAGAAAVWLASVSGGAAAPQVRIVATAEADVLRTALAPPPTARVMTVGEVALAVDTGRDLAARAAAGGAHVVVATASDAAASDAAARALAAALTGAAPGDHGPLGALRRLGDAPIAVLCGLALGAGERGLGCVCHGRPAIAGAAVAAGIEPDLRPRLLAAGDDALAGRLGLAALDGLTGAPARIAAALRAGGAATPPAPAPPRPR
jgi:hypothetical protein